MDWGQWGGLEGIRYIALYCLLCIIYEASIPSLRSAYLAGCKLLSFKSGLPKGRTKHLPCTPRTREGRDLTVAPFAVEVESSV
jgi:hypothetical protein